DPFGFEADRFEYAVAYDGNHTWSRSEELLTEGQWGRSEEAGGSPGRPNSVLFAPAGSALQVKVTPDVFSPDGDGYEDEVLIEIEAPVGAEVNMRIYDREGRAVRTLLDGATFLHSSYAWDGRSDSGRRLPIGIYILYVEAEGSETVKKPIVIAR
ncbi:MAG: gliding motility-associated C-terminal domain-containing protein, partial [Candidatus Zixiibacteriota bacterium]